jgi:hypothetical protein
MAKGRKRHTKRGFKKDRDVATLNFELEYLLWVRRDVLAFEFYFAKKGGK